MQGWLVLQRQRRSRGTWSWWVLICYEGYDVELLMVLCDGIPSLPSYTTYEPQPICPLHVTCLAFTRSPSSSKLDGTLRARQVVSMSISA